MKTIFAHITGGTYRMEVSRQRVSPSTTATVRKPVSLVSDATRAHERAVMDEYTWLALPPHLRALPCARAMVRHWVATGYEWKPKAPMYTP